MHSWTQSLRCVPGLWPKAQGTEDTLVCPPPSEPDQRGLPGTQAPRGLDAFPHEGTLWAGNSLVHLLNITGAKDSPSEGCARLCIGHSSAPRNTACRLSLNLQCPQHFVYLSQLDVALGREYQPQRGAVTGPESGITAPRTVSLLT